MDYEVIFRTHVNDMRRKSKVERKKRLNMLIFQFSISTNDNLCQKIQFTYRGKTFDRRKNEDTVTGIIET